MEWKFEGNFLEKNFKGNNLNVLELKIVKYDCNKSDNGLELILS
jgi:hypothetical protein